MVRRDDGADAHKLNRRNPFDARCVQLALSPFEVATHQGTANREEVEAASADIHTRVQLIKSMKDNLVKLTNEAIKHVKGTASKEKRAPVPAEENAGAENDEFFLQDLYRTYSDRFRGYFQAGANGCLEVNQNFHSEGLLQVAESTAQSIASRVKDNPHYRNEGLCFDLEKEVSKDPYGIVERKRPKKILFTSCELVNLSRLKKYILPVTRDLTLEEENASEENDVEAEDFVYEGAQSAGPCDASIADEIEDPEVPVCGPTSNNETCNRETEPKQQDVVSMMNPAPSSSSMQTVREVLRSTEADDIEMEEAVAPFAPTSRTQRAGRLKVNILQRTTQCESTTEDSILLKPEVVDYFYHSQMKQHTRKGRFVDDPEQLLIQQPVTSKSTTGLFVPALINRDTFKMSLLHPLLNLVDHFKLWRDDPSQIEGALNFEPLECEDEDLELDMDGDCTMVENCSILNSNSADAWDDAPWTTITPRDAQEPESSTSSKRNIERNSEANDSCPMEAFSDSEPVSAAVKTDLSGFLPQRKRYLDELIDAVTAEFMFQDPSGVQSDISSLSSAMASKIGSLCNNEGHPISFDQLLLSCDQGDEITRRHFMALMNFAHQYNTTCASKSQVHLGNGLGNSIPDICVQLQNEKEVQAMT